MKLARVASISAVLIEEGLGFLTHSEVDGEDLAGGDLASHEVGIRLRKTLERLGPTFVKFGQLLATRVDLFDEAFVEEMARLQSEVAPFDTAEARKIVEDELDRPIDEVFRAFSDEPVAAASIAQVYRATLVDGGEVAVKVQRPGLEETLMSDLDALMLLSRNIDRLVPRYRRAMVHRVAEEYAARARAETDFLAEARAIRQFSEVLTTLPEFRIPEVYPSLSTGKLLVMEWMDGTKLGEVDGPDGLVALGFDPAAFCRSMLRLQLSMSYEHGVVHGDTHPGNIILLPTGQIALIDFGLHGHVPKALREKMLELVFAQASGNYEEAVEAFVHVFHPDPKADLGAFRLEMREALAQLGAEQGQSLEDYRLTENLIDGMRIGAKYRLQAESDLFMVIRNLTIVEGIVLKYCPSMDPVAEIKAIAGGILRRRLFGPTMQEEFVQLLPQLALTLSQRPRLAARLLKLERSFNDSRTLGEFLRREDVLRTAPPPGWSVGTVIAALAAGIALGFALASAL